jgi:uncharacterized delta-60 repeat protein
MGQTSRTTITLKQLQHLLRWCGLSRFMGRSAVRAGRADLGFAASGYSISEKTIAAWRSHGRSELRPLGFLSSPQRAIFMGLALAVMVLASGCGGGPQPDPQADPKGPVAVARVWTFDKFTTGANETEPIGAPRSQIGGVVDDSVELGTLPLAPRGLDLKARLEAFSNESGSTYWVGSEAPSGPPVEKATTLGGDVDLDQYQFFRKQDQSASLRAVVNRVFLEAFDQDPNPPTLQQCPWRGRSGSEDCLDVMETDVQLSIFVCGVSATNEVVCSIYNSAVVARLEGWHKHWNFTTGHGNSSDCAVLHPCVDFQDPHFFFDPDEDDDGGSHALALLEQPITVNIPLDKISAGQLFVVNVEVTSSSFNHRQGETYIGSFLRDPAKEAGLAFETTGIEPVQTNLPRPTRPVIQPAPACSGASDPAAGTIQFAEANYFKAEVPGQGALISVTRSGGTKGDVSVLLNSSDGTAQAGKDYEAVSKVIRFGDGDDVVQLIPIKILTDKESEPDETVQLTLSDPRGCAQLGSQATSTLTILDDDGTPPPPPPTFAIGGTVTGLAGTGLTLRNTQNQEQVQPGNGTYSFPSKLLDTTPYDVIIATQPSNPAQICSLKNGSGTIASADITNIDIDCPVPQPNGSLDSTFGSNGKATFPIEPAKSLALQSDGKLVIVGGMTLSRYNPDGKADTAFGAGGKVTIVANGGPLDAMEGVAVQSDGKIVVAGHTSIPPSIFDDFVVARFNPDGSKDTSFGTGGMTITDFAGLTDQAHALAIQPDGKIVVAGFATRGTVTFADADFAVVRYLSDGSLDGTFGSGGKITTNIAGPVDFATAVALQSDGSIIVAGRVAKDGGSNPDFGVVRYLADGRADPSFATTSFDFGVNESDLAEDVVVQADGKIVVGGSTRSAGINRYALARLNPDGTFDKSFGTGGLVSTNFSGQDDFAHALALQADGKIVVAGEVFSPSRGDFGIARYLADGKLDAFGTGGIEQIDFFGGFDAAFDVAIQPDGKIVAVGSAVNGTGGGLAMARIMP